MNVWDHTLRAPLGTDGKAAMVGYIGTRMQAERWHAAGFDILAATDRHRSFIALWDTAASAEAARALVDSFYGAERQFAAAAGIGDDDPDHYRLTSAARH